MYKFKFVIKGLGRYLCDLTNPLDGAFIDKQVINKHVFFRLTLTCRRSHLLGKGFIAYPAFPSLGALRVFAPAQVSGASERLTMVGAGDVRAANWLRRRRVLGNTCDILGKPFIALDGRSLPAKAALKLKLALIRLRAARAAEDVSVARD